MSKIQWESDLVERPFCAQLRAMGWQWIEGDTDVPELTERDSFREVLLQGPTRGGVAPAQAARSPAVAG